MSLPEDIVPTLQTPLHFSAKPCSASKKHVKTSQCKAMAECHNVIASANGVLPNCSWISAIHEGLAACGVGVPKAGACVHEAPNLIDPRF